MGKTVLTVASAAPNPVVYTYTDPNGKSQTVTVNYTSYTVQTAFGVSGITEFSQSNVPLVSSIVYSGDGSSYSFTYEPTPNNSSAVTGRIASITLRTGGTISYAYTGGNNGIESDGTTAGLTRTTSDGPTTYVRSPGAGNFDFTTITDALGNVTASTFYFNTNGYFYETDRAIYNGAAGGTPLAEIKTCYNDTSSGCPTNDVNSAFASIVLSTYQNGTLLNTETQTYTGPELLATDSNTASGATTAYSYNTYTGPYSISFYRLASVVSKVGSSTFQQTTYGYDETTPSTTSGLPQHIAVSTQRGNLTSIHQSISSGSTLTTTNTYDDTGTVLTSTNPNGTTTYGHDSTDTLVTSVTPPTPSSGVSLPVSGIYDANTGLLTSATDPNGTFTKYTYNGMLQPSEIDIYDSPSMTNMVGKTTYTYYSTQDTGVANYQNSSTYANTRTLLDGYGRLSRVAVANGQSTNPWYQQDTCYDADGNLAFQSSKYQGKGWATAKTCSGVGDSYANDALGRIKSITHADGTSIQYSYAGRATQMIDENGVSRITQADGLGRTTIVCEISSNSNMPGSGSPSSCGTDIAGTGFTTNYGYDLTNHKTTITQGAQQRVFQTDWLGRPVLTQEPERGQTTYSYAYNGTGLVVTRQRPQANQTNASVLTTTSTQYDSLGRPMSITYNDNLTPGKNFSYDGNPSGGWAGQTGVNLKGRLAYIGSILGSNTATWSASMFSYDSMGRVINTWECGPTTCGTSNQASRWVSFSYDWVGNLTQQSDPTAGAIGYTYSPANEVAQITGSYGLNGSCCGTYNLISSVQNGPVGPLSYQLGNGLDASFSYDSLGRIYGGWICSGTSQNWCNGGTQIYGNFVNWSGSRAQSSCDTAMNRCEGYGYDEFNRLTGVDNTQGVNQSLNWVYDRYGNRWQQNVTTGSAPSPQLSFNPSNNQASGYSYDAAGNMTSDGTHSYTYDAEGNVIQVDGGSTASYVYDALNRRIHVQSASGTVGFTFDALNRRVTTWQESTNFGIHAKIYWGSSNLPIAFRAQNAQTYFEHQNWMGTERMNTTYNGAVDGTFLSLPFGDGYSFTGSDNDPYHFAQLDSDTETGTSHAQFRQYSSAQGRWMSPDPYDGSYDFSNPQSFNRYSYVLNNPLSFTDPSGLHLPIQCSDCWGVVAPNGGFGDEFAWIQLAFTITGWYAVPGGDPELPTTSYYPIFGNIGVLSILDSSALPSASIGAQSKPNSPARQQCEKNAQQKYNGTISTLNSQLWSNVRTSAAEGVISGGIAGCAISSEIGCFEGGVAVAILNGVVSSVISAYHGMLNNAPLVNQAKQQLTTDLYTCSQIP